MRKEFPQKFDSTEAKTNGRTTPQVGGATRGSQRAKQTKVKLTNSEVAIARKLGITNEQYARQKVRMQS
jgi:phage I-like protein